MKGTSSSADRLAEGLFALFTYLKASSRDDAFQRVMELDLSMSQVRTLFFVESVPHDPALHEVAGGIGLSVAAAGRAADALVRIGLAERHEDPSDRRVKRITLTPAGRDLVERLTLAHREDLRRFAESLTETERAALADALVPVLNRPEIRALTNGPSC
ncbi:MarR family transcriptional regulator [Actinomadura craniellae]|uniref:MarR family transcriptional regulator n=1 Tax=Actinomadura craniellae TaxID=2231787 RepID=A0A365HCC8_9ACTN|nr:MarR family winged helix-turn-helix transcriptional regulator [Actinomadura craniellae]RAY16648.1 MarR family transcriptional regulator [Actinomadura craniellae]